MIPEELSTSEAMTRGVRVEVESAYDPTRSEPSISYWFFLYTVTISNEGAETVQLMDRHWIITSGEGTEQEVHGKGVVGKQPVLAPGESFQYTSGCPMRSPMGSMKGTFRMVTADGEPFEAEVATFSFSGPYSVN